MKEVLRNGNIFESKSCSVPRWHRLAFLAKLRKVGAPSTHPARQTHHENPAFPGHMPGCERTVPRRKGQRPSQKPHNLSPALLSWRQKTPGSDPSEWGVGLDYRGCLLPTTPSCMFQVFYSE